MQKIRGSGWFLVAMSMVITSEVSAQDMQESCDEIRAQIQAHVGVPARPNTDLLVKVGANQKCGFSTAEAYRAVWGDKPVPVDDRTGRDRHEADHDDD